MESPRRNFIRGVGLGTVAGVLLQLGGYFLIRGERDEFGVVMFILVPLVSGFAVAAIVRSPKRIVACCLTCGIVTFSFLLFSKWEGIICCLMSMPLVAAGFVIGAFVGYFVRGRFIDRLQAADKVNAVLICLFPFFIAAADRVERPFRAVQREIFTTETIVDASPERTWDLLATMERLEGPRPLLLRAGLPTPMRCELDKTAIGGRRVCYFDQGIIAQEVTEWRRPFFMGLRITESTLPGRNWLGFVEASYELSTDGIKTKVVRHSTISTRLYPRWYWRPFEHWGVTSEHEFLFSNLSRWTKTGASGVAARQ